MNGPQNLSFLADHVLLLPSTESFWAKNWTKMGVDDQQSLLIIDLGDLDFYAGTL